MIALKKKGTHRVPFGTNLHAFNDELFLENKTALVYRIITYKPEFMNHPIYLDTRFCPKKERDGKGER